jgi:hypothetical protein
MPETIPNRDFIEDLDNAMPEYRSCMLFFFRLTSYICFLINYLVMHGEPFKFPRVPHLRTLFHTGGNMWPGMVSWGSICLRNPAKTPLVPKLPEVFHIFCYIKKKTPLSYLTDSYSQVPANQPILALPQGRTGPSGEYTLSVHTQESLIRTGVALVEVLGIKESDRVEMTVPYHLGVVYPLGISLAFLPLSPTSTCLA